MRDLALLSLALFSLAASAQATSTSSPAAQPARESADVKGSGTVNFIPGLVRERRSPVAPL